MKTILIGTFQMAVLGISYGIGIGVSMWALGKLDKKVRAKSE